MILRRARFAGSWYEGRAEPLRRELAEFCGPQPADGGERVLGLLAPHAGYRYSGAVAGKAYGRIAVPQRVVVLNPNHTGRGRRFSLHPAGAWETPLGAVPVDERLTEAVLREFPEAELDEAAHADEHAGELQLPFIRFRNPQARVALMSIASRDTAELDKLAEALARVARAMDTPLLVVASSDMNHYESQAVTLRKDELALERIAALDPRGLHQVVEERAISMCGILPTYAMLRWAAQMGACEARVLDHCTSGDTSGDTSRVVGYAAALVK